MENGVASVPLRAFPLRLELTMVGALGGSGVLKCGGDYFYHHAMLKEGREKQ